LAKNLRKKGQLESDIEEKEKELKDLEEDIEKFIEKIEDAEELVNTFKGEHDTQITVIGADLNRLAWLIKNRKKQPKCKMINNKKDCRMSDMPKGFTGEGHDEEQWIRDQKKKAQEEARANKKFEQEEAKKRIPKPHVDPNPVPERIIGGPGSLPPKPDVFIKPIVHPPKPQIDGGMNVLPPKKYRN
jgi:hypothetical protein